MKRTSFKSESPKYVSKSLSVEKNIGVFECINLGLDFIYLKPAGKFEAKRFDNQTIEFFGVVIQKMMNEN